MRPYGGRCLLLKCEHLRVTHVMSYMFTNLFVSDASAFKVRKDLLEVGTRVRLFDFVRKKRPLLASP